ncbi:MAG: hypothetical protein ACSW8E_01760 [Clostridia bacterium]
MKRKIVLLLLLPALLLLAACGRHEHQWEDATCTEPETCSICGETRGEALGHRWKRGGCTEPETCARCGETRGEAPGHDWLPATCTEPETCAVCGETRGEALGHDWQDPTCTEPETCARCGEIRGEALGHDASPADYWTASVCSRCGEELAPKLTPDFETYGLAAHLVELGKTYDYKTLCYENEAYSTVGKATFVQHDTTPGDGDTMPVRDGYVWHIVRVEVVFDDDNAYQYGMIPSACSESYYNIRERDDTGVYDDETGVESFTATWHGVAYDCRFFREYSYLGWSGHSNTYVSTFYVQLPEGYDGFVVGLRNYGVPWPDGAYTFDLDNTDTLYYRLS